MLVDLGRSGTSSGGDGGRYHWKFKKHVEVYQVDLQKG